MEIPEAAAPEYIAEKAAQLLAAIPSLIIRRVAPVEVESFVWVDTQK